MYAPGYGSDRGFSLDRTRRLTGMRLELTPTFAGLESEAVTGDHPLTRNLLPVQGRKCRAWKFRVADPETVPLARYVQGGEVAAAAREFPAWRSVYIALPGGLSPGLIHNVARWTGAYVCSAPGNAVYVDDRLLCVHGVQGGRVAFRLPRRVATVTDASSGRVVARDTKRFEADIPLQQTRWFELAP
jgi:hypothetical protein